MSREHRFNTSNKFGKAGETEVLNFLSQKMPDLKNIEDVSNDPIYQQKDIDAILHFNNGKSVPIEIKTDSYAGTGNLVFEAYSSADALTPGCMYVTECEELFYYFPDTGELFQIKMEPYREWVTKHAEVEGYFKRISPRNVSWGVEYYSMGYLIPKTMLKTALAKYIKVYNLKQM